MFTICIFLLFHFWVFLGGECKHTGAALALGQESSDRVQGIIFNAED